MVMEEEEESVKQFMTPTWPTTTMAAAAAAAAASKLCDSCKSSTATLFCRADSAFLCIPCDSKIHAANKLASRHARVWMCEVCEQAPAHVTCKADAAALCVTCDRDIHSANPLARRHHRFPVVPFFDSVAAGEVGKETSVNLNDVVDGVGEDEEAEAASWLIPNPNTGKIGYDMYSDIDPYLDLEYGTMDAKFQLKQDLNQQNYSPSAAAAASINCDGVVPVAQSKNVHGSFVNGGSSDSCFDMDILGSKAFSFYNNNNGQSLSQTVSSSSLDVGVVPDGTAMIDVSNPFGRQFNNISDSSNQAAQLSGVDREARVLRYREKRKNRKFEKTIRYASRKAYAETRPRIKGRFAKRTEMDAEVDQIYGVSPALIAVDTGYGVVPTF